MINRKPQGIARTVTIGMPSAFRGIATGYIAMAAMLSFCPLRAAESGAFRVDPVADDILGQYCTDCHEDGTEKGGVRLDNLAELSLDARLDMMNRVLEKVHFEEMPPKKKDQPSEEERTQLEDWLKKNLQEHNASKLEEKLRMPEYGNKVDHDKLFSGKYKDLPSFTPDRRWLISEFIFDAKFNKLLGHSPSRDIDGKRVPVIGENNRSSVNLTNPFLLPTHSGVRYYDTTTLDGGHLLTMITNAKQASASLITLAKGKGQFPAIRDIMASEWNHEKILTERESYLSENIEPLLRDLFQEKHEALLPTFVATTPALYSPVIGPDGKVMKKAELQYVVPDRVEVEHIIKTLRKHSQEGINDEDLFLQCEKDWFYSGISERTIHAWVSAMHNYTDELRTRPQKPSSSRVAAKPPTDSELAILRAALLAHRKHGDTYSALIAKCVAAWSDEFQRERERTSITDAAVEKLVVELFTAIIERAPTSPEIAEYTGLAKSYFQKIGSQATIEKIIQTMILRTDFVYRQEFGEGPADAHGRTMLSPHNASFALAYALTDSRPDKELQEAARSGKLATREDYRREVERMLKVRSQYYIVDEAVERIGGGSSFTNIPIRKLRFFREFFGYPNLLSIFKDNKRFGGDYTTVASRVVSEADMLVEHILEQDKSVFEKLLTTEDFYVFHSGDNEQMAKSSAQVRKIYEYFKDMDWKNFKNDDMKEHLDFFLANEVRGVNSSLIVSNPQGKDLVGGFKTTMSSYTDLLGKGQANAVPFSATAGHGKTEGVTRTGNQMRAPEVAKCFNIDLKNWDYPTTQPTKMQHRKGILTHPAWLTAFAGNTETDPIRRGKWVREKLLAGSVPDVPVTVDAVIPEDHHNSLRGRLEKVTKAEYCWGCHEKMNPLGLSFEMYDDFGRYRIEEFLEHPDNLIKKMPDKGPPQDDLRDIYKTLLVNSTGYLDGTGDNSLDGEIKDAIDLAERLGKSTKVRQSFIRHAFRYFMGRNEILSDSKTLIDADQAYLQSGGSFDAVIVSLLTSDSFLYRKAISY